MFSDDTKIIDTNTDFTDPFLGMDEKEIINTDEFMDDIEENDDTNEPENKKQKTEKTYEIEYIKEHREKEIINLIYIEGYTYDEVAIMYNVSRQAINNTANKSIKKLREKNLVENSL